MRNLHEDDQDGAVVRFGITDPDCLEDEEWTRLLSAGYVLRALRSLDRLEVEGLRAIVFCLGFRRVAALARPLDGSAGEGGGADSEGDAWGSGAFRDSPDGLDELYEFVLDRPAAFQKSFGRALVSALADFVEKESRAYRERVRRAAPVGKVSPAPGGGPAGTPAAFRGCALERRLSRLSDSLGLSFAEREALKFFVCLDYAKAVEDFFLGELNVDQADNRNLLSRILDVEKEGIGQALNGRLARLGFVDLMPYTHKRVENKLYKALDLSISSDREDGFAPAERPRLKSSAYAFPEDMIRMLLGFLEAPSASPTHILLHGPAGTGKTQFARILAAETGFPAFAVLTGENSREQLENLLSAGEALRPLKDAILIVDEADALLGAGSGSVMSLLSGDGRADGPRGVLDGFMETVGLRFLWVANETEGISESILRRFSFSLSFPRLGAKRRLDLWRSLRDEFASLGSGILSDAALERLAREEDFAPAVISQAFRASLAAGADSEETLLSWLAWRFQGHRELSGGAAGKAAGRAGPGGMVPDAVLSDPPFPELLRAGLAYKEGLASRGGAGGPGLKILLSGAPGTGKAELASRLSAALELDLVRVRPQDLVNPLLGRTERKIREAFQKAEDLQGALLFEGLERLLAPRGGSPDRLDRTLESEFLRFLEGFGGLFVGTVARPGDLSSAVGRRFPVKARILGTTKEGREALFRACFVRLAPGPLGGGEGRRLESLPSLAPRDFVRAAEKAFWRWPRGADDFALLEILAEEADFRLREDEFRRGLGEGGAGPSALRGEAPPGRRAN
ncbi:MAG: ATP-binding protein [Deltaproteobacteria bacterium]|jgi:SpoVK/Ycf46/Vps4 family AAA+-type ATPase|nr:ATP-binding protein [Deltaproteobacteria bacterium]